MLGNILQELGHGAALVGESFKTTGVMAGEVVHDKVFFDALPADTTAQFNAGLLYAWSGQTIDERDYLVGCTLEIPPAKRQLGEAWDSYSAGNDDAGNLHMRLAKPWMRLSMVFCDETHDDFKDLIDDYDTFFARKHWEIIAKKNYLLNKKYVDEQWEDALKSWNTGVYFNAGMFYGRTWAALMATEGF